MDSLIEPRVKTYQNLKNGNNSPEEGVKVGAVALGLGVLVEPAELAAE